MQYEKYKVHIMERNWDVFLIPITNTLVELFKTYNCVFPDYKSIFNVSLNFNINTNYLILI